MSEQLSQNAFASVMASKSNDHLLTVIKDKHRYEFPAVIAAFEELDRRQLLTAELLLEKETFISGHNQNVPAQENATRHASAPGVLDLLKIRSEYFFTPIILYINLLVFALMALSGVD